MPAFVQGLTDSMDAVTAAATAGQNSKGSLFTMTSPIADHSWARMGRHQCPRRGICRTTG